MTAPARRSGLPSRSVPGLRGILAERQALRSAVRHLRRRPSLWVPPGHFYSPIPDEAEVRADAARVFDRRVAELPGIDLNLRTQVAMLDAILALEETIDFPEHPEPGVRYHAANNYFPFCDAFFLAGILRLFRPRRIVEVGSGFSSAVMLEADERWLGGRTELTFVEPHPERLRALCFARDLARARVLETRVQDVPPETFAPLAENDVLFIDSSHVAKTGSDVCHLLFQVLPRLAPGVLVHVHDVTWPFEYGESDVYEGRSWNEAYLVRAFLQYNEAFEILLHPSFFAHRGEALGRRLPERCLRPLGPSLWLRRRAA